MFLYLGTSNAQTYLDYVRSNTEKADVIVKGFIESKESFRDTDGLIYSNNFLIYDRIIKGQNLINNSIAIVTPGGKVDDTESFCFHCAKLGLNEKGLFFLKYEKGRLVLLDGNNGKISKKNIAPNQQGIIPTLRFYVPDWEDLITSVDRLVQGETITEEDLEQSKEELCFKIDSIQIKGERQISAKVYVKSDTPNLKFGGAEIAVKYPISSLGSYIVQNSQLDATAGNFVSNDNVYSVSALDLNDNEFSLKVESNCTSSLDYAILGTGYHEIAELLLEIDLSQIDEVIDSSQITNGVGKYFDTSLNDCVDFREICLEGELLVANCDIITIEIIGDAAAGIGSRALFIGEDFGDSPGEVKLPDADTDMENGIILDELDETLLSWSNDTIEINITALDDPGIMGSGKWRIAPSGLFNFSCSEDININFSMQKSIVTDVDADSMLVEKSKPVKRYSLDTLQGAITYYLDNTIDVNTALTSQGLTFAKIELLVKQALCEWEDKTGISLNYLGAIDPALHTNTSDAKNVIYFTDDATIQAISMGTHTAAFTTLTVVFDPGCTETFPATPNVQIKHPYSVDSRIAVTQENNWYDKNSGSSIGSNQFDLYTILLHEIGHSLGLNHALDPDNNGFDDTRAMYPDVENNNDSKHTIDNGDAAGGMYVGHTSRGLLNSPNLLTAVCVNDFSLNDDKFCMTTSLEDVVNKMDYFKVFPNICLVNTEILIKNEISIATDFKVFNSLGNPISQFNLSGHTTKAYKFTEKGIYFISAIIGNQLLTQKIIVQ